MDVPVLGGDPDRLLSGFPEDSSVVTGRGPARPSGASEGPCTLRRSERPEGDRSGAVLLPDSAAGAVGRYFALATGKRAVPYRRIEALPDRVRSARTDRDESLTVVLAPLASEGVPDVSALATALEVMPEASAGAPWGILAAETLEALSRLAARNVLWRYIVAGRRQGPVVVSETPSQPYTSWAPEGDDEGVSAVCAGASSDGLARRLAGGRFRWLILNGHGRNYCCCQGLLCGAHSRATGGDARPPDACLDGMECADPEGFHAVDPGAYDTPVLVLQACAAGTPRPFTGVRAVPVAVQAASGAATTVIACRWLTISHAGDEVDVFRALARSETLGEAVRDLNRRHFPRNAEDVFYLLGDPDVPVGPEAWPDLCPAAPPPDGETVSVSDGGLAAVRAPASCRSELERLRPRFAASRIYREGTEAELFGVPFSRGGQLPVGEATVGGRPREDRAGAAERAGLDTDLRGDGPRHPLLRDPGGRHGPGSLPPDPSEDDAADLLASLAARGVAEDEMVRPANVTARPSSSACPSCEGPIGTLRDFVDVHSRERGTMVACEACGLIHYGPDESLFCWPAVRGDAEGGGLLVDGRLRNGGDRGWSGAVALSCSRTGLVAPDPPVRRVTVGAGQERSLGFVLRPRATDAPRHVYRLRAIALLDGRFVLSWSYVRLPISPAADVSAPPGGIA